VEEETEEKRLSPKSLAMSSVEESVEQLERSSTAEETESGATTWKDYLIAS
jgi:hypothetical protein